MDVAVSGNGLAPGNADVQAAIELLRDGVRGEQARGDQETNNYDMEVGRQAVMTSAQGKQAYMGVLDGVATWKGRVEAELGELDVVEEHLKQREQRLAESAMALRAIIASAEGDRHVSTAIPASEMTTPLSTSSRKRISPDQTLPFAEHSDSSETLSSISSIVDTARSPMDYHAGGSWHYTTQPGMDSEYYVDLAAASTCPTNTLMEEDSD
ncbi:unnamed protein product, partial [Mesorhabditis spiculigera]